MSSTLETEIKLYNNMLKQQEITFSKLSQFFKTMSMKGISFVEHSKKSLEDYFSELKNENETATHIIGLKKLYDEFKKYFDKLKEMFQKINTQFADKITEFFNNFKNSNNESIKKISDIIPSLKDANSNLKKAKNEYFNASKPVIEQENKVNNLKENKSKKEDSEKKMETKYQKALEDAIDKYKMQINKYNKLSGDKEIKYSKELKNIHNQQENKIQFIYDILNDFKKELISFSESTNELANFIEKLNKSMNISRDVDLFKDEYNFYNEEDKNNRRRFPLENFLDFEVLKKSGEETKLVKSKEKKINKIDEENNEKLKNIIVSLFNYKGTINEEDRTFLINYMNDLNNNCHQFLDILIENYNKKEIIKIDNLVDFSVLSNSLISMIDRNSKNNENLYEKYYFIIELSENIIYIDKEDSSNLCYLCKKLKNLGFFSKMKLWSYLIDKRIINFTKEKTKADIEKKEKNKNLRNNIEKENNTYYSKIKGYFFSNNDNDNNNKKFENEIVFGTKYKDNLPLYCLEVIEKFIQHFSNFSLSNYQSRKIIEEVHEKYKFDGVYYNYFIAEINSNNTLSKKTILLFQKLSLDKNNKWNKENLDNNINNINNIKMKAIISSLQYLDKNEYKKIMIINKECYQEFKKLSYIKIFLKTPDMEVKEKLSFWKKILDCNENKKKYDYEKNKNSALQKASNNKGKDVIDLDVLRTVFDKDKEKNKERASNILKTIFEIVPEIKYNQGMNYIVSFFLYLTENEEDTFYLFLGLLTSTKYGELFKNDLAQLKKYFYVFERLISIFLPELYIYFLHNNMQVNYFMTSWFITLFTNTFNFNKNKENPKILLTIFDLFFFYDWKAIMIISLALLKKYESQILLASSSVEILQFINNEIIKANFFENENFDNLMYIILTFEIKEQLIENIEKEIDIKREMPNLGKNMRFQII
jgi:hypothetical protein